MNLYELKLFLKSKNINLFDSELRIIHYQMSNINTKNGLLINNLNNYNNKINHIVYSILNNNKNKLNNLIFNDII